MRRKLFGTAFKLALGLNAKLTRSPLQAVESRVLTPLFVRLTHAMRGRRQLGSDVSALGYEWERLLASRRTAHITEVDESSGTAWGEITVDCPLRGTGDVHACHRLMAYDRRLVDAAGGQFMVVESQATPGRTKCRIAIRAKGASMTDLVPAHERKD